MDDLTTTIESMTGPSTKRLSALSAVMSGVGEDAARAFRDLSAVSTLPGMAASAAEKIRTTRADTSLPSEHRHRLVNETLTGTNLLLRKMQQGGQQAAQRLEAALVDGLLPRPHADASQRALVRDEVRTRFGGLQGGALTDAVLKSLGADPSHDAEVVGSFGASLFAAAGAAAQHKAIRAQAVERYLARPDGSDRQQAARKALQVFRASNVASIPTAYVQSARVHLAEVQQ